MAVDVAGGLTGYRATSGEITIPLPGSTLEHVPAGAEPMVFAGSGKVVTYSIVHVPTTRFKDLAPYALAVIELDEGARLLALVDGGTAENLAVDARVRYTRRDEHGYHFELQADAT
jgi:uncharacterized OB-fold protein